MTYAKPAFRHPDARTNDVGCTRRDYEGGLSTLCAGCGNDSISAAIIDACFELSIERPPTFSAARTALTACMGACRLWRPGPISPTVT